MRYYCVVYVFLVCNVMKPIDIIFLLHVNKNINNDYWNVQRDYVCDMIQLMLKHNSNTQVGVIIYNSGSHILIRLGALLSDNCYAMLPIDVHDILGSYTDGNNLSDAILDALVMFNQYKLRWRPQILYVISDETFDDNTCVLSNILKVNDIITIGLEITLNNTVEPNLECLVDKSHMLMKYDAYHTDGFDRLLAMSMDILCTLNKYTLPPSTTPTGKICYIDSIKHSLISNIICA